MVRVHKSSCCESHLVPAIVARVVAGSGTSHSTFRPRIRLRELPALSIVLHSKRAPYNAVKKGRTVTQSEAID